MKENPQKKRRMFSWMNPKLEVRDTKKYGKGVFAKKNLKKDEALAIIGGYVMTLKDEHSLPVGISDLALQISDNFVIGTDNIKDIGPTDFFNHSCDPNAGWHGQIFLVAMRAIMPEEQVCFDYAMTLGGTKPYSLKCGCGLDICRRKITNLDWKKSELQKKYNGYFQWYLQAQINK